MNILDLFCPYRCKKCGRLGSLLCGCCKKHIIVKQKQHSHLIKFLTDEQKRQTKGLLKNAWTCGWRDEILGQLTQDYKFYSIRAAGIILAEIMSQIVPSFKEDVIVVPLPTSSKHIRQRGFDHTAKIAKYLARFKGWQYQKVLRRLHNKTQVGTSFEVRQQQAEEAYELSTHINPNAKYLLIDDIWTTGASICAAARILREAGAKKIYAATIAVSR